MRKNRREENGAGHLSHRSGGSPENLREKGEADAADIAKAVGLSSAAAEAFVRQIDEDSFADVIEIDLCCGEEYIVKGLTEQGRAFLGKI